MRRVILIVFVVDSVKEIIEQIGKRASIGEILDNLHSKISVFSGFYDNVDVLCRVTGYYQQDVY